MMYCADQTVELTESEFHWALDGFTPSALRNIPLLPPGGLTWADVGGLHDVRKVLEQTLLWPAKVVFLLFWQNIFAVDRNLILLGFACSSVVFT
jgi:SpoVK/Ycf46/Vps4 family AAA+-type ATPase